MPNELILQRSVEEIQELQRLVEGSKLSGKGSRYPTMTYEDGILETLRWLFGDGDHPLMGIKRRQ